MSSKLRERQSPEHAGPQAPAHQVHDAPEHAGPERAPPARGSQQALARDVWRPPAISDSPASSGDETAQLDAIIQAIPEAATAAGLTTCLRRAWRVISAIQKANPAPDPRFGGTAGSTHDTAGSTQASGGSVIQPSATFALTGRVKVLVDVAIDRMWLLVRHEGDALDPARDLLVQIAGAVPGVTLEKLPPLVEDASRQNANNDLGELSKAVLKIQRDAVTYMVTNFAWYAVRAASNPRLDQSELMGNLGTLGSAIISFGINEGAEYAAKALEVGLEVGKMATKLIGAAFSFVVGEFLGAAFEWMTHAEQGKDEASRRRAAENVGSYLLDAILPLIGTIDSSRICDPLLAELTRADTETDVAALAESFRGQRAVLASATVATDMNYGTELLRTWVLRNAGEDDGAGKKDHVSELDWQQALRDVTGNPEATEINQCPDLFVHQTRSHFRRMGLEPTGDVATIIGAMQSAVVRTGTPEENAEATYQAVDDKQHALTTRVVDIESFQRSIAEEGKQMPLGAMPIVMMYGITGTLSLDLGTNHDSVYVDSWGYDVEVPGTRPSDRIFVDAATDWLTGEVEILDERMQLGTEPHNRLDINMTPD